MKGKVFHIITKFDVGGAERVAINVASCRESDMEQHIVEVIRGTSKFSAQIVGELRRQNITYHRSLFPVLIHFHYVFEKLGAILFPFRFLMLWLMYKPTIVHSHTEMPDMAIWLTLKMFPFIKVKVVRTIHNTVLWSGMDIIGPKVEKFMQERKANVAISPNVQQAYFNTYGELPPIIYNGVSPVSQQKYSKIVPAKVNICFAGRFEEQKGIDVLCSIIKALRDDSRYYFHVFGSGRQQYLADDLKGLPNVSINPPVNGISTYMLSFDFLIMPSRHEGLSILALEASFNGLPLLINSCAGLVDTVPEDWSLKVHDNDMEEWMHLFNDVLPKVDVASLRDKAFAYVNQHFSLKTMQEAYNEFYNKE